MERESVIEAKAFFHLISLLTHHFCFPPGPVISSHPSHPSLCALPSLMLLVGPTIWHFPASLRLSPPSLHTSSSLLPSVPLIPLLTSLFLSLCISGCLSLDAV